MQRGMIISMWAMFAACALSTSNLYLDDPRYRKSFDAEDMPFRDRVALVKPERLHSDLWVEGHGCIAVSQGTIRRDEVREVEGYGTIAITVIDSAPAEFWWVPPGAHWIPVQQNDRLDILYLAPADSSGLKQYEPRRERFSRGWESSQSSPRRVLARCEMLLRVVCIEYEGFPMDRSRCDRSKKR